MLDDQKAGLRLGILAQGGRDWMGGVVYLQNLVRALNLLPEDEQPHICMYFGPGQSVDTFRELGPLLPPTRSYTFRTRHSLTSTLKAAFRTGGLPRWPTSLEQLVRSTRATLFPVGSPLGVDFPTPWIAWIPDFQHKRLPRFFPESEVRRRDSTFHKLVQQAPHVVVSSQDARGDLLHWFPDIAGRVSTLPFVTVSTPEWYEGNPGAVATRLGLPRKFIIYPSQFWMHKNHRRLFDAVGIASRCLPDLALVCTGQMNDPRNPGHGDSLLAELNRVELRDRVHCLGLLDRTTQVQLIRAAVAVVQPSLFEGWSALLEDARALGKQVYISDIPIHREQNPPHARFFDPESPEELAALIVEDWNQLEPGPDLERERAARLRQEGRALDYARRSMDIFTKVSATC
jgi:glycosyltransferase involved in cell wall biosynthesis